MKTSIPATLFVLLAAPTFLGAACEQWPLFAHLPEEDPGPVAPSLETVLEDPLLGEGMIQDLGTLVAPSVLTILGETESCGFQDSQPWPRWPDHPMDVDGDGVADTEAPRFSGWFSGETDFFGVSADSPVSVGVTLTWENAPPGSMNAPFQPTEEGGDWATESDLDWVVFSAADGEPVAMVSDAGFSSAYPQSGVGRIVFEPGVSLAVVVGCHHEVPTAYTLELDVQSL